MKLKYWLYEKYGFLNRYLIKPVELLWWSQQDRAQVFPNFMCVAAQKCGTTWLWENLQHHPDIYLPDNRYLHYWNHHFNRPLGHYAQHFSMGRTQQKGEVMPDYGLMEERRIRFIHRLLPELKLIFMLRNPIDRAWSHARMALVQREQRSFSSIPKADFIQHFRSELSQTKGDYLTMLKKWQAQFPKEAIFIGYFEELSEAPEQLLNRLFSFLKIRPIDDFSDFPIREKINLGAKHPIPDELKVVLEEMYRDHIEELYQELGAPVQSWRILKKQLGQRSA